MDKDNQLSLDALAELVEEVARERRIDVRVLGATPTEGEGAYAEVVVARLDDQSPLSIGIRRDETLAELRRQIAARLSER
jgi:hypothetical protein